ncbi:MAG: hypothetical protein IIY61_07035, partial [Ruminococcus sp.]|nr:hypothetical protein [Ruminococcus sp.]
MKKTILSLIFTFCVSAAFYACSSSSQDSSNGTTVETTVYNGPCNLDHGIEKMREYGIMRLTKGRSTN